MDRTKNVILRYFILGLIFVILIQTGILHKGDLLVEVFVYVLSSSIAVPVSQVYLEWASRTYPGMYYSH
ncbi:MAG: hypothetical protein ACFFC0_05520 [Promethearchaeota archaeon]